MSTVYAGQDLQLTLNTYIDCTSATTKEIRAKKSDGTTANYTASVVTNTKLRYSLTDTDTSGFSGTWYFQAYIVTGGFIYWGREVELYFKTPETNG